MNYLTEPRVTSKGTFFSPVNGVLSCFPGENGFNGVQVFIYRIFRVLRSPRVPFFPTLLGFLMAR